MQPYMGLGNSLQTAQGGAGATVGGWVELARTTLGSGSTTLDVSSLPDKRYYMLLTNTFAGKRWTEARCTFNNDTGTNYSNRQSQNGGVDSTQINTSNMMTDGWQDSVPKFHVGYIANIASKEKLFINHMVHQNTAGAGTAPQRLEGTSKWANTANSISSLKYTTTDIGGDDIGSGSECVVLGWDPADTHTTNFWEDLGTFTNGTTTTDLTITSKKYLWIQGYTKGNGDGTGWRPAIKVGNTTISSADYANRESINGGADGTYTSQGNMPITSGGDTVGTFFNVFIINNASNEKLAMGWSVNS